MKNQYVFILNEQGERITSLCDNSITKKEILMQAQEQYPNYEYLYSADGDSILDEFMSGKTYVDGNFVDAPVKEIIKTKVEKIAEIKQYYNQRFEKLDDMVVRRRLAGTDIEDLQKQFNDLNQEMLNKIKEVK